MRGGGLRLLRVVVALQRQHVRQLEVLHVEGRLLGATAAWHLEQYQGAFRNGWIPSIPARVQTL